MVINLSKGRMVVNNNLDGWVITSASAVVEGAEDVELVRNDRIDINGNVYHDGDIIANVA